jgi:ferredoxin
MSGALGLTLLLPPGTQGYALMCVGFPRSDLVLQMVEEDEVYDQQVRAAGRAEAARAGRRTGRGGAPLAGSSRSLSALLLRCSAQFGRFFAEQATDPNALSIVRDDFAIELALLDE